MEKKVDINGLWDAVEQDAQVSNQSPTQPPVPEQPQFVQPVQSLGIKERLLAASEGVRPIGDVPLPTTVRRGTPPPRVQPRQVQARRQPRAIDGAQYGQPPSTSSEVLTNSQMQALLAQERERAQDAAFKQRMLEAVEGRRPEQVTPNKGKYAALATIAAIIIVGGSYAFVEKKGPFKDAAAAQNPNTDRSTSAKATPSPTANKLGVGALKNTTTKSASPSTSPSATTSAKQVTFKSTPLGCAQIHVEMSNVSAPIDFYWTPGATAPSATSTAISNNAHPSPAGSNKPSKTPTKPTKSTEKTPKPTPTPTKPAIPTSYHLLNALSETASGVETFDLCDATGKAGLLDKNTTGPFSQIVVLDGGKLTLSVEAGSTDITTQPQGMNDKTIDKLLGSATFAGQVTREQMTDNISGINATARKLKELFRLQMLDAIGGLIQNGTDGATGLSYTDEFSKAGQDVLLAELATDITSQGISTGQLSGKTPGKPSATGIMPSAATATHTLYGQKDQGPTSFFHSDQIAGVLKFTGNLKPQG